MIVFLLALIGAVIVFNQIVIPSIEVTSASTPTATQDPEALASAARASFEAGNLTQAISNYQQAILADRTNSNLYVELALVQILSGEYEAAETSARNALLLNSSNPRAYVMLAWALGFLDETLEAEQHLNRALELDPSNAEALAVLAEQQADAGDYVSAGDNSRAAMELLPNSFIVRRARGYVLELTGNYEEAIEQYNTALELNNNIAELHIALGRVYRASELYNEAINEFALANSLNPSDPMPDTYMARIYLTLGEYPKAIQSAEQALEEDPSNPYRYGVLGMALFRNLQFEDCIEVFKYAIHGGTTEDGVIVTGLPIDYGEIATYYAMYAIALARVNRCSEALPITQAMLTNLSTDAISVENAEYTIGLCQEQVGEPTPTVEEELEATPES